MAIQQDVILTTENCRYCLMCRHVCPVGNVTRKETLTPHGWGLIIASVRRGLLTWNPETVGVLYSCADCGTCQAHCVTDQPLPDAIAAARDFVAGQELAPAVVYETHNALKTWGNPYREKTPEAVTGTGGVALFVGDEAAYLWPTAVTAVLKLLEANGVLPILVGKGRSNGYLASSLGFPDTAKQLIQATLDEVAQAGASRLLVFGPGDQYAFGQHASDRLGLEWPANVEVQQVVDFLAQQSQVDAIGFKKATGMTAYAYVDPTHTVRIADQGQSARLLLESFMPEPAGELFWRRDRSQPVGNVALKFTNPHIADQLTHSRLADIVACGARLAVCEDPGTLSQLQRHAPGFGVQVFGLYELLCEHLI